METPLEAERSVVCFFDRVSNISIVREAEAAVLQGLPIVCTVYVAGGHTKKWKTQLYHIPWLKNDGTIVMFLAMGMAKLTGDLEAINHKSAPGLLPDVDKDDLI